MQPISLIFAAALFACAGSPALANSSNTDVPAFARGTAGVEPFVDPVKDLNWKKEYNVNSWFAIGHFEQDGHKLNYLYHVMIMGDGGEDTIVQSVVSITDETTGWYQADDVVVPLSQAKIGEDKFSIKVSNGLIEGDFNRMRVVAELPRGKIDLVMKAVSPVLYNGGTGVFPFLGMAINEYSVPRMASTGTLVLDGKTYNVKGPTWFDRQFQVQDNETASTLKWSWMDINLDNGDAMSLWSAYDPSVGRDVAWATILHADGSQTTTAVEPLSNSERDYWTSAQSGNTYPTRWTVRIPQYNAVLDVTPSPRQQEVVSQYAPLHKYEGASAVIGTYRGKPVTGFGYVELVGKWNDR